MTENTPEVVFFDIGNTLGSPKVSSDGRLAVLSVYAYVPDVLRQLHEEGRRLGVISNIGSDTAENVERVLEEAGILTFFQPELLIYGPKNTSQIFRRAAEDAAIANPQECLFVGEDARERQYAIDAGWHVVPHPRLVTDILNNYHLRYIRITIPAERRETEWERVLQELPIVPIHLAGTIGTQVYAIASTVTALRLDDLGFEVDRLGDLDAPLATEMYLMRDDRQVRTGFLVPEGHASRSFSDDGKSAWVLSSSQEGLYIALPAGQSIDAYHFEEAYHGHNLKLIPNMSLLQPFNVEAAERTTSLVSDLAAEVSLSKQELENLAGLTSETIQYHLDRYSGIKPIEPGDHAKIKSRHIDSDDNARVTDALVRDLENIGAGDFLVYRHQFDHPNPSEHLKLYNVVAEWQGEHEDGIVIVSAHLDSTASFGEDYNPDIDPAPGADDDGSGVAGVLAIAQTLKRLNQSKKPKRTIRFVLFNAEEQGLVGSQEYARDEFQANASIVAVYQMDMIGYRENHGDDRDAIPRPFEIHAGHQMRPSVEQKSLQLAQQIQHLVGQVSPNLKAPEIYKTPDVADMRSDHSSFQQVRYPAILLSEDLFLGPPQPPVATVNNPNYHTKRDLEVDCEYAADIARVVAAAAWKTANS